MMETNRLDRPNKSPVKLAEPPADLRQSGGWTALQYWMERSVTGHLTMVVCDGCGSTYWGKWEVLIREDGPNTTVPILTGGLVWDSNGNSWSCTCPGGRPWRRVFPQAPPGVIQKSMEMAEPRPVRGRPWSPPRVDRGNS